MGLDYRVKCCPDGLVTDRRRRIRVLDCTIRDGGICNDWAFDKPLVRRVFRALSEAGVDYMELGYRVRGGQAGPGEGPWRTCHEDDLQDVISESGMRLCTMVDAGRIDPADIPAAADTATKAIRIATYAHQMDEALRLLEDVQNKGYETFVNVMAISTLGPDELDNFLLQLGRSGVDNVAIVDSYGALYPHHVRYLVHKYMNYLGEKIKVGVHFHNNQQQAFANTIAAIDEGVDFVDATVMGMGRGAGNCPLELLLFYLDNPRYDVAPVLDLVETFAELNEALRWGYHPPYAITGYYNLHPKPAMDRMARPDRYQVRGMYEQLAGRLPAGRAPGTG